VSAKAVVRCSLGPQDHLQVWQTHRHADVVERVDSLQAALREADPEFKAAFDYFNDDRMVERIKQGYRHELERKSREAERTAQAERRRQRVCRLTFGLLPR
jgi:hypothetical protein